MSNKTGGPAFSQCVYNMKGGYDITGGMTMRDYFAAKAMQGITGREDYNDTPADCIAIDAYAMADAMLKAREA